MKTYDLRGVIVQAADIVDGVLVDPIQPGDFDSTDNKSRPFTHAVWWGVPFIRTHRPENPTDEFLNEFPNGIQIELRCLDGGAWDRSTWWGRFSSIHAAVAFAKQKEAYVIYPVAVLDGKRTYQIGRAHV